jgi:UDP-glucose 4-epimerase
MNILEWVRELENKPRMIFAGSSSVHSGKFKNPYTFSKNVADDMCMLYKKHFGVNVSICRFYNVYGPHQLTEGEYCTVVGIFERQYKNQEPLTITGDGFQRRDFTHIDDIVDGLILTSENEKSCDEIELGRGNNYSINELADMFTWNVQYIDARPGEAKETLCDISVAKRLIGYEPTRNIEDYIEGVVSE